MVGRGVLVGILTAATAALVAQSIIAPTPEDRDDDFPVLAMYGVGEAPPIDGGDVRARFEVAVDHAVLLDAATAARATVTADGDLSASDRALRADLVTVGWGDLRGRSLPAPGSLLPEGDRAATHRLVESALTTLAEGVEAVNPVAGNRYEVVGATLARDAVAAVPGVVSVDEVGIVVPLVTDDPHLGNQWGLENVGQTVQGSTGVSGVDIGLSETLAQVDGRGVVVAIVDSGIQTDHPDLAGRFWSNTDETCGDGDDDDGNGYVDDCAGWDFVNNDASPYDRGVDNRHGTHVAGIVAAGTDDGVGVASLAGGATLMPLKVFQGGSAPDTRITAAIEYAVDNGAHVINLSLGGPSPSASQEAAIERARQAGVLVVIAAGNDGTDNDVRPMYPASFPQDNIIAVGSHANTDTVSSFSNYGATTVDVFAPGEQILSTLPGGGWGYLSGTSMAAPMVTAMAAVTAQSWATTDATTVRGHVLQAVEAGAQYTGRAASDGRVSAPLALSGAERLGTLSATITGVGSSVDEEVRASVTARLRGAEAAEPLLGARLARLWDRATYAVLDHAVGVTLDGVRTDVVTDETGAFALPALSSAQLSALAAGELVVDLEMTLPPGRYVVALSATTSDGGAVEPVAAFFNIPGVQAAPAPGTGGGDVIGTDPGTGAGGGGGTTTPPPDGGTGDGGTGGGGVIGTDPGDGGTGGGGGTIGTPPPSGDGGTGGTIGTPPPSGDGGTGGTIGTPPPSGDGGTGGTIGTPPPSGDGGTGGTIGTPPPDGSDGIVIIGPAPGAGGGGTGGDSGPAPEDVPVWPTSGPDTGGTWVTIDGTFDPMASYYVHVGDRVHRPLIVTTWALGIVTQASVSGTVDVVVLGGGSLPAASYPGAYTYLETSGGGTGGGSGPVPAPDAGGGTVPSPDGDAPAPLPGTGGGGDQPLPDDGGNGSTPTPEDGRIVAGNPITTDDGLVLDRLIGGPLSGLTLQDWNQHQCTTGSCRMVEL